MVLSRKNIARSSNVPASGFRSRNSRKACTGALVTTNQTTEEPQSFFRRWRPLILLGVLIVMGAGAARLFMDHRANSPIVDPYLAVIDQMSLHSPRARQRLEQYYAKHQRQTVASKHYPLLCNEMQELALGNGLSSRLLLPDKRSLACPVPYGFYEEP